MTMSTMCLNFEADTKPLLDLVIHSLYTDKEIFLREIISNASDALDRLRFEALTEPELLAGSNKYEIRLDIDKPARTLTVSDTGIGMSREEVVANIGTIAKSGTRDWRRQATQGRWQRETDPIGKFGVGFYSAFMVADKVKLVSRRAGESGATVWWSDGSGTYQVEDGAKEGRGTSITLYLKAPDAENGIEDYSDEWLVSKIVRRHSDFIGYPIIIQECSKRAGGDSNTIEVRDRVLNSMKPIWTRQPSAVSTQEYGEFYKHIFHDWADPLKTIHFRAEGAFEYDALLYIPRTAQQDLYYLAPDVGLRLFAKRVMVVEKCADLLPHYLRFVQGVVDAGELPLNISRQRLQQDNHVSSIRKRLSRKVLQTLQELFEKDRVAYAALWREFGRAIKEGVASDLENKDRIVTLLLFQSSHDQRELTSLNEYVARMKPGQQEILYLTGESRAILEQSPHIETAREAGLEVLYLVDGVDELLLQHLPEYDGKKLKSLGKGTVALGGGEDSGEAPEDSGFFEFLQKSLELNVKRVRFTNRLKNSPCCLVVEEHDYSPMLERMLQRPGESKPRRILELNPKHPLICGFRARYVAKPDDSFLSDIAELLFGLALLGEGSDLADSTRFGNAAREVLARVLELNGSAPPVAQDPS